MTARILDEVRLIRDVAGVPAGATGTVVIVYERGGLCVELDDPELTATADGSIDVDQDDVTVVRRWAPPRGSAA